MTEELRNILRDWSALLRLVGRRPTHVKELVEHQPQYQGFVDASKWGVGGVLFSRIASMIPIVWFLEWPQEIPDQFCSSTNKSGQLTISDLDLTGILLQWLVLEQAVDTKTLKHNSIAIWCDNLPAVAWTYKFQTSTSPIAARILRALAVRLHKNQTALLSVEHISGIFNNVKTHTGLVNQVSHAHVWEHVWEHVWNTRTFGSTFGIHPVIWVIRANPPILHTE
jgi:hypothetical protein